MPQTATLGRTFALIVGIEQYELGHGFDLFGPAGAACRFADWLLTRQVKPEHLFLFLSPLERRKGAETLTIPSGVTPLDAAENRVHDFIIDDLARRDGELLIFYWAGHGIFTETDGGGRRLFFADATPWHKRNLDLQSLLRFMRSGGFLIPRQVCVVDTCANRVGVEGLVSRDFPSSREAMSGRGQFVFLASQRGQYARNLSAERSCLFTAELLDLLAADLDPAWPPDLEGVARNLRNRFNALRRGGQAQQTPAYFSYTGWDGEVSSVGSDIAESGVEAIPPPKVSVSRLPTTGRHFVGRADQLKQLDEAWGELNTRVLVIRGWGGAGKTALINRWLKCMAKSNYRGARYVLGWSFNSQETAARYESADYFLDSALKWFSEPDRGESSWNKAVRLANLVRQQRTLLILDGFERLQYGEGASCGRVKDKALLALLKELVRDSRSNGLCVITTRENVTDLDDEGGGTVVLELEQLSSEEGADLLRSLGVDGTDEQLQETSDSYAGHCLSLTLLGTYISRNPDGATPARSPAQLLHDKGVLQRVSELMNSYKEWLGAKREWALLRLLGFFDRPANRDALQALRQRPPLRELTEAFFHHTPRKGLLGRLGFTNDTPIEEREWLDAIGRLKDLGLVAEDGSGALDAHPLVRQYFARQLQEGDRPVWRRGHDRLYVKLGGLDYPIREEGPKTIEEMLPLYHAVKHGCQAGLHEDALIQVYVQRILRWNEFYDLRRLGAFSFHLGILAYFFEDPWLQPVQTLSRQAKGFVLNMAGFCLRGVGRLREALHPMGRALRVYQESDDLISATGSASNLTQTYHFLGRLREASDYGHQGLRLIDSVSPRLGVPTTIGLDAVRYSTPDGWNRPLRFWQMGIRTDTAAVLHQLGRFAEAEALFKEAESIQSHRQPNQPLLYSLPGYWYCDLLLSKAETYACNRQFEEALFLISEVQRRSAQALTWIEKARGPGLLDSGLHHLAIGRALLLASDIPGIPQQLSVAAEHLDESLKSIRQSGHDDFLPFALHARTELSEKRGDVDYAFSDANEALSLAQRSHMRLHETDGYLLLTKLHLSRGDRDRAQKSLACAERLAAELAYWRRKPMLNTLSAKVT